MNFLPGDGITIRDEWQNRPILSNPKTNSKAVAWANSGDHGIILSTHVGQLWVFVLLNGRTGWMVTGWLKKLFKPKDGVT